LEFVAVKKIAKNLEMMTTTMNGPRGEFNFIFIRQNHNKGILLVPLELNKLYSRLQRYFQFD